MSHIQELDFSTDVVGDSRNSSFHISATALALLAIDDNQDRHTPDAGRSAQGISMWTVSSFTDGQCHSRLT